MSHKQIFLGQFLYGWGFKFPETLDGIGSDLSIQIDLVLKWEMWKVRNKARNSLQKNSKEEGKSARFEGYYLDLRIFLEKPSLSLSSWQKKTIQLPTDSSRNYSKPLISSERILTPQNTNTSCLDLFF